MKIKPLEFVDAEKDYWGRVPRTTAESDTWGPDTDMSHPRIYNRFDVFRNNNDEIRVASTSLGLGPVTVETFEEGKALCNQWHRNYWEQLLTDIKSNILENED